MLYDLNIKNMDNNDYLIFHNINPSKSEEKHYESLYEELLEKCNPNNFMQPYDKEKVDTANTIFAELRNDPNATDYDLKEIRLKAVQKLGIHISTQKILDYLTKYCDPKRYTDRDPYDAELVFQANALYSQILDNKDDIFELEKIEILARPLIDSENERKRQIEREQEEIERQKKLKEEEEKEEKKKALTKFHREQFLGLLYPIILILLIICATYIIYDNTQTGTSAAENSFSAPISNDYYDEFYIDTINVVEVVEEVVSDY